MRILHIAQFGKRASGIGSVVTRLQKEQIALGHDVRIVTITENLAYKNEVELTTCYSKNDFKIYLSKWKPDAVLFHSIWSMPYIQFAKLLKAAKIPYAIMMHGADSKVNRRTAPIKKWLANFLIFNRFMRNASAVIYLSKTEVENCLSAKNNKNNIIIPNGCKKALINIDNLKIHTPVNVIYLGRIEKYHKGVDVLLDALDILKSINYSEVKFNFYANENDVDLPYLKDRLPALEGLASYCGGAYGEYKAKVLREADAFILTSRSEGMPMGVLEALSYGVPCILTPGTNMADDLLYVGAGWKADLNAQSIANKIQEAVSDLKRDYLLYHNAAYKLSENYDWTKIAHQHIDVMKNIVTNK